MNAILFLITIGIQKCYISEEGIFKQLCYIFFFFFFYDVILFYSYVK